MRGSTDAFARRIRVAAAVLAGAGSLVLGYAFLTDERPALNATRLQESLEQELFPSAFDSECRPTGSKRWSCAVSTGSAGATYSVEQTSRDCWRALRTQSDPTTQDLPSSASACVR